MLSDPRNRLVSNFLRLPDVCVAYKLHLECPRLINLYDWCQAFSAVVDPDLDLSVCAHYVLFSARVEGFGEGLFSSERLDG